MFFYVQLFDKEVKSFVYVLEGTAEKSKMQLPKDIKRGCKYTDICSAVAGSSLRSDKHVGFSVEKILLTISHLVTSFYRHIMFTFSQMYLVIDSVTIGLFLLITVVIPQQQLISVIKFHCYVDTWALLVVLSEMFQCTVQWH